MRCSRTSRLALLAALFGCVVGCGGDGGDATRPRLEGPPVHEATRVALPGNARGMIVRARAPCRLRLIFDGLTEGPRELTARALAAGEDVRIWWEERLDSATLAMDAPTPDAKAQGRSKGIGPGFEFAFEDRAIVSAGTSFYVRPSAPTTALWDYQAPVRPEPLEIGTTLELSTYAVADLDEGAVRILPHASGNRAVPAPADLELPQQVRVFRLLLKIDAAR
ncbi:MAG: hypothetical protein QNJ98_03655 [Planctomycetota bacterium]|nr:hypothetical protein [Planctomycetota bacterium]